MKRVVLALLVGSLAIGGAVAHAGPRNTYKGTLTATPSVVKAGDHFSVKGCGYNAAYGNVVVGFTGGSWGSALDSDGCFTLADVPALSGDTLPAGTYEVTASQFIHRKWIETGDTSVTVVS